MTPAIQAVDLRLKEAMKQENACYEKLLEARTYVRFLIKEKHQLSRAEELKKELGYAT